MCNDCQEEACPHDFGWALRCLKRGKAVARKGWKDKGTYIKLQTPDANSEMTFGLFADGPNALKGTVPWLPSHTDMLAEDWEVVKEAK